MIKVLKNWTEIGDANMALARCGLPRHVTTEKNWDLLLLKRQVDPLEQNAAIIDLGCGDCYTLKFLSALGFTNLLGIDLSIPFRCRLSSFKRKMAARGQFRVQARDILRTGLRPESVDMAVCISVIEHGVPVAKFFQETARVLRKGAMLFITTDYWPEAMSIPPGNVAFGLPWQPFDRRSIADAIAAAARFRLRLDHDEIDFEVDEPCICWAGHEYTFIALLFRKE